MVLFSILHALIWSALNPTIYFKDLHYLKLLFTKSGKWRVVFCSGGATLSSSSLPTLVAYGKCFIVRRASYSSPFHVVIDSVVLKTKLAQGLSKEYILFLYFLLEEHISLGWEALCEYLRTPPPIIRPLDI